MKLILQLTLLSTLAVGQCNTWAQDKVLNLYSARHYPTDEALYSDFTKATGIRIQRVDADDAGILARLKAESEAKERERQLALAAEQERLKAVAAAQALEQARLAEAQRLKDLELAKAQAAEEEEAEERSLYEYLQQKYGKSKRS